MVIALLCLSYVFMLMVGWWMCVKWRYKLDHLIRILRSRVRSAWLGLTKTPDIHTPYNRKRVLKRLNDL